MYLFTVDETYMITGRGLLLTPGLGDKPAKIGDALELVKPDKTILRTVITGIVFNEHRDILVGANLTKEDVPIGTEVWLQQDNES
ncbi:hypothetical protein [Paracnuella aquatica]|uniref:hypothetical protein n=1 Tax=Paracnuella aquatica TaxID=2268757 RepID=UPI000DEEC5E1|nr:hypothetical protein [Paracnuella aquatica]RPD43433.1 hypothetical protein DRJ53_20210 [Paracnuella aquatica]